MNTPGSGPDKPPEIPTRIKLDGPVSVELGRIPEIRISQINIKGMPTFLHFVGLVAILVGALWGLWKFTLDARMSTLDARIQNNFSTMKLALLDAFDDRLDDVELAQLRLTEALKFFEEHLAGMNDKERTIFKHLIEKINWQDDKALTIESAEEAVNYYKLIEEGVLTENEKFTMMLDDGSEFQIRRFEIQKNPDNIDFASVTLDNESEGFRCKTKNLRVVLASAYAKWCSSVHTPKKVELFLVNHGP